MSVTDDVILEQVEFVYDAAGNVIQTVTRQRYHNASAGQTGPLQNPSTTPKARVTYTASWPDALGRTQASANYGTNGGAAFTRPGTIPSRSDNVLVSSTDYDSAGNVLQSTDPSGMVTRFAYDDAGRETERVMNYQADPPPPESSSSSACSCSSGTTCGECGPSDDVNVTVETAYNADGNVSSITAKNAATGDQVTQYVYGTTLEDSDIASSLLKRQEIYPDSVDEDDVIEFSYNRQQQVREVTDQAGTVHAFDFDKLGRPIHDRVTTLGTGVDGAVRRISTEYEVRGMRSKVTSWNNASVTSGDVVNQCQSAYNNFGQLTTEWQSHSGTVNTSTTPRVEYGYADGSGNTIRPETLTYPDGRVITSDYGAADSMPDALSRVASLIDDDDTHLTDYSYLGLGSFVVDDYTEPDLKWTLADLSGSNDPDTGDIYSGLDRFGRVKDNRWYDYGNSVDADRIKYGYDRAGNRIWRNNTVAAGMSKAFDELYSYDGVHRLKDMQRGTLNGGRTAIANGTSTFGECWTLDSTGNWNSFRQDDDGNGCWDLDQTRTANAVNEITNLSETAGPAWITPAYSRAGNMTTIPKPADPTASFTATYDAWNRLVKLEEDNGSSGLWSVAEYAYDGSKRRVVVKSYTSGTLSETRHAYFTASWQNLEERLGASPSSAAPDRQFVWGLRYIDDLLLRDRDTNSNGTLNERLYTMQDANWNVTAIADASATIEERYAYAAYGTPLFLDSSFDPAGSSAFDWETLFCGYRWDAKISHFSIRHRVCNTRLGVWLQRDPLGISRASATLYQLASSQPLIHSDPSGLIPFHFAAFIAGVRGDWLPEPFSFGLVKFKTDQRAWGEPGTSRLKSKGFINSCSIGAMSPMGVNVAGTSHIMWEECVQQSPEVPCFPIITRTDSKTATLDVDLVETGVSSPCMSHIIFYAAASYPFVFGSPSIDYIVSFMFFASKDFVIVNVAGIHDRFPDYEAVVDGQLVYYARSPDDGPTIWNLGGYPKIPFSKTIFLAKKTRCKCGGTCE